ncbi:hypothetical protein HMPREF9413_4078 [Paenibacillus sp. HGF7]|nr:hypothetical protein HMPREF9413_4078 [Paenibacillus sp. HGF7]
MLSHGGDLKHLLKEKIQKAIIEKILIILMVQKNKFSP